ncbi:MAG: hypothetical protein M3R09_12225, partial [Actinomycetota bacterium]|nr:hypothetical protein [Actinomycetota bacterium]
RAVEAPDQVVDLSNCELWDTNIRDRGGQMKGAELSRPAPFEHGDSHTVQLVPGVQHLGTAQAALPLISSGMHRPIDQLVLEQHPDREDPTVLRLQVVTRSPIKQTVWFDQPRHEDGRIALGPYADGCGDAAWRLYTEDSMWGGFVLGGIGSGKTKLIELIALSAIARGDTYVIYIDGQSGASSPVLFNHPDIWSAGPDGSMRVLAALERISRWRNKENRVMGLPGFTPSPERPGILTIIDECHRIFPQAAGRWADLATEDRKLGKAYLAADQHSGLTDVFGGQDRLRSALLSGNGAAMRTTSRIAGNLIPGLDLNPFDLPVLPGYGYLVAPEGSGGRTAPFRGRRIPGSREKTADPSLPVPSVEEWFERLTMVELDGPAARAAGPDFTERHERAEAERSALLDEMNSVVHETNPLHLMADLVADGTITGDPETVGTLLEARRIDTQNVREAILALDWGAHPEMRRGEIVTELKAAGYDYSLSAVQKALGEAGTGGGLEKVSHGLYRLTATQGAAA